MQIRNFLNRPFTLLDYTRHRWVLIVFCMVFCIVFINVFVPYNINRWSKDSGVGQFLRFSGFGIVAGFVLTVSQFGIRKLTGSRHLKVYTFVLWSLGEMLLLSVFFLFYQFNWKLDHRQFLKDFAESFKYTFPGIVIAYSLALLLISQLIHKKEMEKLRGNRLSDERTKLQLNQELINFPDEKGTVRFSIAADQVLYIESADNYVIVNYLTGDKVSRQILRNSMKNTETIAGGSFKRCHRSFLVNLRKIEFIDYGRNRCRIRLCGTETGIPVSRKFYPDFKQFADSSLKREPL